MSFLTPNILSEEIILELKNGGQTGPDLLKRINEFGEEYTKQAMYSALRQLIADEAVVRARGVYTLSTSWIRDLQAFVQEAGHQYSIASIGSEVLFLKDKESVTYVFNNTQTLDAFWGHIQNLLVAHTPQKEPVCAFDPHYWFLIARSSTEAKLLKGFVKNKRQFLMLVPSSTSLDRSIKSEFDGEYTQYAVAPLFKKQNYYVTAIQDYVIEVTLDIKLAAAVERVYQARISRKEAASELEKLLTVRAKNRIKVSRNRIKAERIKKSFKKYFYIKSK